MQIQEYVGVETEHRVPMLGTAGTDYASSGLPSKLHRNGTNGAGGAMNQNGLAGDKMRVIEQALPCGQSGNRQRGGHRVINVRR